MKRWFSVLALMLVGVVVSAQNFISVSGKVEDAKTSDPVFFASVGLSGTNVSNVTNSEGVFSLKLPEGTDQKSMVTIHHLGYLSYEVTVGDLMGTTPENPLKIKLVPTNLELDPAYVRAVDPEILIRTAYARVKQNYSKVPVAMTSFYRESIKKGNSKYLVLNEAVLDIAKAPYNSFATDKVSIYKGRGSMNYDATDTLFVQFQGGIASSLAMDIVKNPFAGTTLQAAFEYYDFHMADPVSIDDHTFLVVRFTPKKGIRPILFVGDVYIDPDTYAIAHIDFSMALEGREEEAVSEFIVKKPADTKFAVSRADYVINFKQSGGLWYYDYSRMDISFNARKKHSLFRNTYSITGEMAVTDHEDRDLQIESDDRVKLKDILSEKVSDFEDESFWEDYNVIEPDQSIDQAIKKIVRQLRRRKD